MNKGGDAPSKTEESVHFDSTFSMVEIGPWTKLEAKFYCAAVKGIDHFVNVETAILFVIKFSRLFDEVLGEVMVNAPILFLIHFAKSGTRNERESGMVKFALKRCQSGLVGAQTLLRGQLCKAHDHKLVTTAELNLMAVAIVPCDTLAENVFWEQRHELGEYTLTLIHLISTLQYYKMQRYEFKSSKKYFSVIH